MDRHNVRAAPPPPPPLPEQPPPPSPFYLSPWIGTCYKHHLSRHIYTLSRHFPRLSRHISTHQDTKHTFSRHIPAISRHISSLSRCIYPSRHILTCQDTRPHCQDTFSLSRHISTHQDTLIHACIVKTHIGIFKTHVDSQDIH